MYQGSEDGFVRVFEAGAADKLLAEHDMGSPVYSTPVYANGTLYVMTRDKLFAVAPPGPATRPTTAAGTAPATGLSSGRP